VSQCKETDSRTSATSASGCSRAAKWPPSGWTVHWVSLRSMLCQGALTLIIHNIGDRLRPPFRGIQRIPPERADRRLSMLLDGEMFTRPSAVLVVRQRRRVDRPGQVVEGDGVADLGGGQRVVLVDPAVILFSDPGEGGKGGVVQGVANCCRLMGGQCYGQRAKESTCPGGHHHGVPRPVSLHDISDCQTSRRQGEAHEELFAVLHPHQLVLGVHPRLDIVTQTRRQAGQAPPHDAFERSWPAFEVVEVPAPLSARFLHRYTDIRKLAALAMVYAQRPQDVIRLSHR
jgi:hypothetical protein